MSREIAVIGAGNLGANIAYFLSEQGVGSSICLYDPFAGRAQGKALDMIEAQPIRRALPRLRGCDSLAAIGDAKITVVALTADMFADDQAALHAEAAQVAAYLRGYQGVVVVAPPYERELLPLFHQEAGLDMAKLIGLGTVPHTMYAVHLISQETGIDPRQIQLLIVGSPERPTILTETVRAAAIPFARLHPDLDLDTLLTAKLARFVGDARSNYYRVAAAAARVVEAVESDLRRTLPVTSIAAAARYGTSPQPFAMPSVVSAAGVDIAPFAEAQQVHDACVAAAAVIREGAK